MNAITYLSIFLVCSTLHAAAECPDRLKPIQPEAQKHRVPDERLVRLFEVLPSGVYRGTAIRGGECTVQISFVRTSERLDSQIDVEINEQHFTYTFFATLDASSLTDGSIYVNWDFPNSRPGHKELEVDIYKANSHSSEFTFRVPYNGDYYFDEGCRFLDLPK